MTVGTHLKSLASTLVLADAEKLGIAISINTLSSRLNSYFGASIKDTLQFGSSTRGTILPRSADPKSDIDYMVVFDTDDGEKKPQAYLNRLRVFAEKKYSTSQIAQSSPTIVLSLNHIRFELVPGLQNWFNYRIPSPASSWTDWINTNPKSSDTALQDKNKEEKYQIKPLVRLIKYWNAQQGYPFASFAIEQHIVSSSFWFCSSLTDYFYQFWDDISCTYDSPKYVKDKVDRAKRYALQAKDYENRGMPANAQAQIEKIVPPL